MAYIKHQTIFHINNAILYGMFRVMHEIRLLMPTTRVPKNPDEAMDFLNYMVETSKGWDEPNPREVERMKPTVNPRGGIYSLTEEVELKAKLSTLNKRMEELEQRNQQPSHLQRQV